VAKREENHNEERETSVVLLIKGIPCIEETEKKNHHISLAEGDPLHPT
jgi:hypothetical protein